MEVRLTGFYPLTFLSPGIFRGPAQCAFGAVASEAPSPLKRGEVFCLSILGIMFTTHLW